MRPFRLVLFVDGGHKSKTTYAVGGYVCISWLNHASYIFVDRHNEAGNQVYLINGHVTLVLRPMVTKKNTHLPIGWLSTGRAHGVSRWVLGVKVTYCRPVLWTLDYLTYVFTPSCFKLVCIILIAILILITRGAS